MSEHQFPPLVSPEASSSEKVLKLHDWWLSRIPAGRRLPTWSSVDVGELGEWIGWLLVFGILPDRSDAKYRLVGSEIVKRTGYDLTGRMVSQETYTLRPELVMYNLRRICDYGAACLQIDQLTVNRTGYATSRQRLWMPFSEDGSVIDRIVLYHDELTAAVPDHQRESGDRPF